MRCRYYAALFSLAIPVLSLPANSTQTNSTALATPHNVTTIVVPTLSQNNPLPDPDDDRDLDEFLGITHSDSPGATSTSTAEPYFSTAPAPPSRSLMPAVPWNIDLNSLDNVKLNQTAELYYAEVPARNGERPPANAGWGIVTVPNMKYKTVQTEKSNFVSEVVCSGSSMTVRFSQQDACDLAWESWEEEEQYMVITDSSNCVGGGSTGERTFFRVDWATRNGMEIVCEGEDIGFEESVDEEENIQLEFSQVGSNSGNSTAGFTANANAAANPTNATTLGNNETQLVDPSGDTSFDEELDAEIGVMDDEALAEYLGQFNLTIADFFEPDDLPDLVSEEAGDLRKRVAHARRNLAKRGLFSRIKKAFKKVKEKVKQAVKKVVEVVKKAAETIKDAVETVVEALDEFTTISKTFGRDVGFEAFPGDLVDTPFGDGVLLFSKEGRNETLRVDVFCVECGAEGDFRIDGKVEFSLVAGFKTGLITATGDMQAGLAIGILANFNDGVDFSKRILTVPLSPFSIPGILIVGPSVSLSAGAGLSIDANGRLLVGAKAVWPNIRAQLDLINRDNVAEGFTPDIVPIFEAGGDITIEANAFLDFKLAVGIDILNGRLEASVGLIDRPKVTATAEFGLEVDLDGVTVGNEECGGIGIEVGFDNEVLFDVFGNEFNIFTFNGPSFDTCILEDLASTLESRDPFNRFHKRQQISDEGASFTQIRTLDGSIEVHYSPNGNSYAVPLNKVGAAPDGAEDLSDQFSADPTGAMALGDTLGRYFHGYVDTIRELGVSRLRLHKANQMPETASIMSFAAVENDEGGDPFLVLADLAGDIYFPIICTFAEGIYPKLFLANDTDIGATTLMDPALRETITGNDVIECGYLPLTNAQPGTEL
ncbi:hypothetical protein BDY21DRAFT_154277 [Lineolata rhizophorae]|uniref:Uncharacterized protein n=1 Tax=Lineolata rhizophorae TaxID=578093 RepID=A0A6A6NMG8_9PEZI|nr:hypothetical protein BDY21DRAFT_154277 [Lineolata rhizophorae]